MVILKHYWMVATVLLPEEGSNQHRLFTVIWKYPSSEIHPWTDLGQDREGFGRTGVLGLTKFFQNTVSQHRWWGILQPPLPRMAVVFASTTMPSAAGWVRTTTPPPTAWAFRNTAPWWSDSGSGSRAVGATMWTARTGISKRTPSSWRSNAGKRSLCISAA